MKMRSTLPFLSGALLLFSATAGAQEPAITTRNAWVRAVPPSKTETALYVTLENHTAQRRDVVGGTTDVAEKVELHEMKMNRALMVMSRVPKVALPARGKAEFDPGGLHVMLFGLKTKLAVGDSVTVTLTLDDGTAVPVIAKVKKE